MLMPAAQSCVDAFAAVASIGSHSLAGEKVTVKTRTQNSITTFEFDGNNFKQVHDNVIAANDVRRQLLPDGDKGSSDESSI